VVEFFQPERSYRESSRLCLCFLDYVVDVSSWTVSLVEIFLYLAGGEMSELRLIVDEGKESDSSRSRIFKFRQF
jgi:hypothetical protein